MTLGCLAGVSKRSDVVNGLPAKGGKNSLEFFHLGLPERFKHSTAWHL